MYHYTDPPRFEPSESEIKQRCLQIQLGWTREIERSRRVYKAPEHCQVPRVKYPRDGRRESRDEVSY